MKTSQQPQQPPSTNTASAIPQQYPSSNIPTHKPNFQQTLPRYNHPPPPPSNSATSAAHNNNNNLPTVATRRIIHRGRYSTGTASSLIPSPGSYLHQQHHPPLVSPALSTLSTASTLQSQESIQPKSHHLAYPPSRIPGDMLKFQVRKSDVTDSPAPPQSSIAAANAQIQVSLEMSAGATSCFKLEVNKKEQILLFLSFI